MNIPSTFKRAIRGLREHFYLATVSVGVITAALVLVGVYALVVVNVQGIVAGWQKDVHVSAYFAPNIDLDAQAAMRDQLAARSEIAGVEWITQDAAASWMAERMPEVKPVLDELGPTALPASLEITLRSGHQGPETMDSFAAALKATGSFVEIDYGREWVERVSHFLTLLRGLGIALGIVMGLAALFLVGNTINLVVYARRDELEIMRLVGATDRYILAPFIIEGAVQATVALTVAFIVLQAVYQGVLMRMNDVLPFAFDSQGFQFLPPGLFALMAIGGWFIGVAPAWVAVRRFLAGLP